MLTARDAAAWIWVVVVVAASAVPFRNNPEEVRKGTPHFVWYVAALALVVAGVAAYLLLGERVRRWEVAAFGAVLGLLPLVFRRGRRRDGVLWLVIGISYLSWARSAENLRFPIPTWMVLMIALSGRVAEYWEEAGRGTRAACVAGAGYCFVFALQVSLLLTLHVPRVQYIAGQLERREYLRRILSVYPAVEWLNREVGAGERVCAMLTCPRRYAEAPLACLLEGRWQPLAGRISQEVAREGCPYVLGPADGRAIGDVVYRDEVYWVFRVGGK